MYGGSIRTPDQGEKSEVEGPPKESTIYISFLAYCGRCSFIGTKP